MVVYLDQIVVQLRVEMIRLFQLLHRPNPRDVVAHDRHRADDLCMRVFRLEERPHPRDRPAGPRRRDEMRDFSLGLTPDFGSCCLEMRRGIRLIGILVRVHPIFLRAKLFGLGDRALRRPRSRSEIVLELDNVRAEKFQRVSLFQRHLQGYRDGEREISPVRHHRQSETRVAGRGFHQMLFFIYPPDVGFVPHHIRGHAVLDGPIGIVPFDLTVDFGVLEGGSTELHERRRIVFVGKELFDVIVHAQRVAWPVGDMMLGKKLRPMRLDDLLRKGMRWRGVIVLHRVMVAPCEGRGHDVVILF